MIQIPYQPSEDVLKLLEAFRDMINYCISVVLEKSITLRFKLSSEVYHKLNRNTMGLSNIMVVDLHNPIG